MEGPSSASPKVMLAGLFRKADRWSRGSGGRAGNTPLLSLIPD